MATIQTKSGQTVTVDEKTSAIPGMNYETATIQPEAKQTTIQKPEVTQVSSEETSIKPQIIDRGAITENITNAYKNAGGGDAIANKAFIEGALKASGQQYNRSQIEDLGLTYIGSQEELQRIAKNNPSDVVSIGKDRFTFGGRQPNLDQTLDFFGLSDAKPDFGLKTQKQEDAVVTPDGVASEQKETVTVGGRDKTLDERIGEYTSRVEGIRSDKAEEVGLSEKEQAALTAKSELDQIAADLDFKKILDIEANNVRGESLEKAITETKDRVIPNVFINNSINKLVDDFNLETSQINREKMLESATNLYKYNTKVVQYNLLNGEAAVARKAVEDSASAFKEYRAMAIDDMARNDVIDRQEAADLQTKNNSMWQKESAGYTPITADNYEAMVREYGENRIYTDAYGDSYLKPETPTGLSELEVYEQKKIIDAKYREEGKEIVDINGVDYVLNPDGSYSTPTLPTGPKSVPQDILDKANTVYDNVIALQETDWGSIVGSIEGEFKSTKLLNETQEAALAQFDKLNASLTLENMGVMKGVLSDADIAIIKNASTALRRTTSESEFNKELLKIKRAAKSVEMSQYLNPGQTVENSDGSYSYMNLDGTMHTGGLGDGYDDTTLPKLDYNIDEIGTETLDKISKVDVNKDAGQCGRFVNQHTGLGVGDSYESKMSKMDPNIKYPEPGMVFTMPYKNTGHTGFIVGINGDKAIVKDSNWKLNEKVNVHEIPIDVITGLTYA